MNGLDYAVVALIILGVAIYGIIRTRGRRTLHDYLKGKRHSWLAIGLSVMATQASAVTFLSTPGQGYSGGMSFVQNYFAIPLAMVIIAVFFLPMYRRLNVYTAYEYLGKRFDHKTRLFASGIFLLQRGLNAGYTIYAPAIVLSTVFGWSLSLTIVGSSVVCIVYTVAGGSDAVTHTQKYQFAIIMGGMIVAFFVLLSKIPCSFTDALSLAGHFGKTNAVSFNPDLRERYTVWTGLLGGIFLMLSYFGTDQSQVQRYISGDDLRESRLGLMFNALMKIPMQFFILLLGVMIFVFYLFHPGPIFFNKTAWNQEAQHSAELRDLESRYAAYGELRSVLMEDWAKLPNASQKEREDWHHLFAHLEPQGEQLRKEAKERLSQSNSKINTNDSDYVFITFILDHLPHGLIGLLIACFFAATLNSKAGELNALTTCTVIDFIRPPPRQNSAHSTQHSELQYIRLSRWITIGWGVIAMIFALFLFNYFAENLIQATNIVGSVFYGVILGLFLIAFFIKFVQGNAAFWGAVLAEALVLGWFVAGNYIPAIKIAYLWYNAVGSLGCIFFAVIIQLILGQPPEKRPGFPVVADSPSQKPTL